MATVKPEEFAEHVLTTIQEWCTGYLPLTPKAEVERWQHRVTYSHRTSAESTDGIFSVEARGGYDEDPQLFRVQIVIEEIH